MDIDSPVEEFLTQVIVSSQISSNPTEIKVLDDLEILLETADTRERLNKKKLEDVERQIHKLPNFSERYGEMLAFLKEYQEKFGESYETKIVLEDEDSCIALPRPY